MNISTVQKSCYLLMSHISNPLSIITFKKRKNLSCNFLPFERISCGFAKFWLLYCGQESLAIWTRAYNLKQPSITIFKWFLAKLFRRFDGSYIPSYVLFINISGRRACTGLTLPAQVVQLFNTKQARLIARWTFSPASPLYYFAGEDKFIIINTLF